MVRRTGVALLCAIIIALTGCSSNIVQINFYAGDTLLCSKRCDVGGRVDAPHFSFVGYDVESITYSSNNAFDFSAPLYASCDVQVNFYDFSTGQLTQNIEEYTKQTLNEAFVNYGERDDETQLYDGEVRQVYAKSGGYYVIARGNGGVHKQNNPYITVGVGVDDKGRITRVKVLDSHEQSAGYVERLNRSFLSASYGGKWATTSVEDEPLVGATISADVLKNAVCAANNYLVKQEGINANSYEEENSILRELFDAQYSMRAFSVSVNNGDKKLGEVLYAANGLTTEGRQVLGLIIRNSVNLSLISTEGAQVEWSDSQTPSPHKLAVIIDTLNGEVIAARLITDGSKKEWFVLADSVLHAYYGVKITSADVFDRFKGALVTHLPVNTEWSDFYGGYVISGSSALYTGATAQGTFSSQFLRVCFAVAARYYISAV